MNAFYGNMEANLNEVDFLKKISNWGTYLSIGTSGIHLQTQKYMWNTS